MAQGFTSDGIFPYNAAVDGVVLVWDGTTGKFVRSLGYVPYDAANPTGYITTAALSGYELLSHKDATGGYVGMTTFTINFKNAANTFTSYLTNVNVASRTYTFQDRNGTIADDTDLALKLSINRFGANVQTSAVDITLTNPMVNIQNITMSTTSKKVFLPVMNAGGSFENGREINFRNTGSNTFTVYAQDTATLLATVLAGQSARLQLTDNSTANGTFNYRLFSTITGLEIGVITGTICAGDDSRLVLAATVSTAANLFNYYNFL